MPKRSPTTRSKPRGHDTPTLWSLLIGWGSKRAAPSKPRPRPARSKPTVEIATSPRRGQRARPGSMAERYDRIAREMPKRYGFRVTKWRKSMSGVASRVTYPNGRVELHLEAPKPKGPMSAAVFLHEVGHHAIGVGSVRPRCLEEYRAWQFAIEAMHAEGIAVTDAVKARMRKSLEYAVAKAQRRGLKRIPVELTDYLASSNAGPSAKA